MAKTKHRQKKSANQRSNKPTKKTPPSWRRVQICGLLTTTTDLHIGDGGEELQSFTNRKGDNDSHRINTLMLDGQSQPFIPGSTLRGFLRSQFPDGAARTRLFGLARQSAGSELQGQSGAIRVYDAAAQTKLEQVQTRTRNSIDSLTGTTRAHHLVSQQIVPPQSSFTVEIWLDAGTDDISLDDVHAVLAALSRLSQSALGKSKSTGLGKLVWSAAVAKGLSANALKRWLRQTSVQSHWQRAFDNINLPNEIAHHNMLANQSNQQISLRITVVSPLLIGSDNPDQPITARDDDATDNDSADTGAASTDTAADSADVHADRKPNRVAMRRGQLAVIPGSTLKGWLRSHARKILLTITQNSQRETVDQLIGELFGSLESGASAIRVNDALCPSPTFIERQFNAVDRFSGGVKESALFSAEAVQTNAVFAAT